jgi:hypothetical protein
MASLVQTAPVQAIPVVAEDKREPIVDAEKAVRATGSVDTSSESDARSEEFQPGVSRVRAVTAVWSRKDLVLMFSL